VKKIRASRATRAFEKAMATSPEGKHFLQLYVAGATTRSRQALRRVYQLCEAELKDNYELEVIDVYQQPELARDNQIVATPTLVKKFPGHLIKSRRFIMTAVSVPICRSLLAGDSKRPAMGHALHRLSSCERERVAAPPLAHARGHNSTKPQQASV
jgi:circadian clock protein KaiB